MSSDCDNLIRAKSDQQLQELDKKYPGFIQVHFTETQTLIQSCILTSFLTSSTFKHNTASFLQMKAIQGVKMSFRLQVILQRENASAIRGLRVEDKHPVGLASYIYSLIRSQRSQRRALLSSMLTLFEDSEV